jgi:uncharacterized membrane protein YgcG
MYVCITAFRSKKGFLFKKTYHLNQVIDGLEYFDLPEEERKNFQFQVKPLDIRHKNTRDIQSERNDDDTYKPSSNSIDFTPSFGSDSGSYDSGPSYDSGSTGSDSGNSGGDSGGGGGGSDW